MDIGILNQTEQPRLAEGSNLQTMVCLLDHSGRVVRSNGIVQTTDAAQVCPLHARYVDHWTDRGNGRRRDDAISLRMQALIERTTNFVALVDAAGRLMYLNPAGKAMLGIAAAEDVSGMLLVDLHTQDARETLLREAFPAAISHGTWLGRSVLRSRDNRDIETSQVIIAHEAADGSHDGWSIVEHDMTAWIQGERDLLESHEELARLSAQLITVQETERRRIAADLHDGIGQSLTLMKLQVATAAAQLEAGATADALATLKALTPKVCETIGEVRRIATDLHPSSIEDLGIVATLGWFFRELESACQGIAVDKDLAVREADVHPSLRITIFRILQEAVSNIIKHAMPNRISVKLKRHSDRLLLSIEDDGQGFDPGSVVGIDGAGRGFGLSSMKERARVSGGVYRLHSAIGRGTRIQVEWPVPVSG